MAKVKCPNGHVFETNIYGNQCPLCNAMVGTGAPTGGAPVAGPASPSTNMSGPHTRIGAINPNIGNGNPTMGGGNFTSGAADPTGATLIGKPNQPQQPTPPGNPVTGGSKTTIRRPNAQGQMVEGRKLVGFLVCYNRYPNGKAFNIYEGRNYVGRDASCDISIPDDTQMSTRHMSILYRSVDNKFKFRDEQSSNGTFINKVLQDDGELENYDIIRVGSTLFIFIAIPNIS